MMAEDRLVHRCPERAARGRISADLLKALNNPLRREVLRLLHRAPDPLSARRMSRTVEDTGNGLSHHLRVLADLGVVKLVGVEKVRGVKEKFFASEVGDNAQVCAILVDTEQDDAHVRRRHVR